jgi:hypothetical protein
MWKYYKIESKKREKNWICIFNYLHMKFGKTYINYDKTKMGGKT